MDRLMQETDSSKKMFIGGDLNVDRGKVGRGCEGA